MGDEGKVEDVAQAATASTGDGSASSSSSSSSQEENVTMVAEKFVEFINGKRAELELKDLNVDANVCAVANEHAKKLLELDWTGMEEIPGKGSQRRYYEGGSQGCIKESRIVYNVVSGQRFGWTQPSDMLDEIETKVFDENPSLKEVLLPSYSHVGFGFAHSDTRLYIVCGLFNQSVELANLDTLNVRASEDQIISGSILGHNSAFAPCGCTITLYSEAEEGAIPAYTVPNSEAVGQIVATVNPWDINFEPKDGTFSFPLNVVESLQRQRIYDIPAGIYHVRLYVHDKVEAIPYDEEKEGFVVTEHVCACSASLTFPPQEGSGAYEREAAHLKNLRTRRSMLSIESVSLLPPGQVVPPNVEIYPTGTNPQNLPLLCFTKAKSLESGPSSSCVVELAIAFGEDDVPPGFDIVKNVVDNSIMNLRQFMPGSEGKDQEENDEDAIYFCVRTSDDPVEISTRGIADIILRSDGEQVDEEFYERLDILPGVLHAVFRLVGMGSPQEEDCDIFKVGDDFAEDIDDSDEEETEEVEEKQGGQDGWDAMEDKGFGKLDRTSLQGGELGECILPTAESKRAELEEAEKIAQANRIESLIENAKAEREKLTLENMALQRSLVPFITKKKLLQQQQQQQESKTDEDGNNNTNSNADDDISNQHSKGESNQQEKERQFTNSLSACNDALDTLKRTRDAYDKVAMDLQTRLDDKEAKAAEIRDSFSHFKREIAKSAENSRTGKPIPMRIIKQFEETEVQKDADVEKVRLKNINLRSQLRKLESALHEKEKLAEGLHLIDFEQLKIENQTLNEKIEERNEELHKLKKKTTTTVQVLTHIKEKLQFVQAEAVQLKEELGVLDVEMTSSRDQLTKSKHARDAQRAANEARKRDQGFVNSGLLVEDFQQRKRQIKALKREIRDLQLKYANLTGQQLESTSATEGCKQQKSVSSSGSDIALGGEDRHE